MSIRRSVPERRDDWHRVQARFSKGSEQPVLPCKQRMTIVGLQPMKTAGLRAFIATALSLLLATISHAQSVGDTIKEDAKSAGHAIADASKSVGHEVADASRKVGHTVAAKSKEAGHAIADTSKSVGSSVKDGAKKTADAVSSDGSKSKD
jgi:hypothetical protein